MQQATDSTVSTKSGDEVDLAKIKRLRNSIRNARQKMKPFREKRMDLLKQFVGYNYSNDGAEDRVPVNLLDLAITIYLQNLSAKSPRIMCSTQHMELKNQALMLEMALNHLLPKIRFADSMRRFVIDALFSWGIVKVGLEQSSDAERIDGFTHAAGQPFVDVIDLDDWFFDVNAKRWDQIAFCGNRYRIPLADAKVKEEFDPAVRSRLVETQMFENNEWGESPVTISSGSGGEREFYEPLVELEDVWIPRENKIITLASEMQDLPPLQTIKWKGPAEGPYIQLGFSEVPGNIYPKAPAMNFMDLHELTNMLFRKLGRQAERAKTIAGVMDGGEEDGQRVIKANDGEMVKLNQPDRVREFKFGGADPQNLAFFLKVEETFSRMAGNLDTLGGLSPQAGTLGQEELLQQGSSKKMQDMQSRTVEAVRAVVRQIAWYLWHDPLIQLPLTYQHPAGVKIPMTFSAEDKKGDYWEYDIDIDPYSMTEQSPGAKLQAMMNIVQQLVIPMAPQIQQQGGTVDFQLLFETIAKYGNTPEVNQILKFQSPPQSPQEPQVSAPPQKGVPPPAQTQHTSVRVNRGGATARGKTNALISQLIGGGTSPQEQAMSERRVG